ncbi:MAG TPA: Lrp/AsnC family transcriptional regulator, partial [Burkholderiales bacterium]|nr:Lrp/AsnC family transcriptional regulator [Burkholderiales bacterium]
MQPKPGTRNPELSALEGRLLNDFQRDFPLEPEPYARIAAGLGIPQDRLLRLLAQLQAEGRVSRVGVVFRPNSVGASTLAAMAVPEADLERVAAMVSAFPEVNHNYEREHRYNLWFVVTAPDTARLEQALARIAERTGHRPVFLPLLAEYHIDLGFDMSGECAVRELEDEEEEAESLESLAFLRHPSDTALIAAIQGGFPLVRRPFADIAARAGLAEHEVLTRLCQWLAEGVVKRVGVIVRHHELGYRANAMVVWDVPDAEADRIGRAFARHEFVTLCYRRPRRPPNWPYNLFCMIHGRDRGAVLRHVEALRRQAALPGLRHEVLFSRRRFKQRGAL